MTTLNGPLMDQVARNVADYDLQRKFGVIETWAVVLNESITDHAGHIDHATARLQNFHSGQVSMRSNHDQLSKDVKEVMS